MPEVAVAEGGGERGVGAPRAQSLDADDGMGVHLCVGGGGEVGRHALKRLNTCCVHSLSAAKGAAHKVRVRLPE